MNQGSERPPVITVWPQTFRETASRGLIQELQHREHVSDLCAIKKVSDLDIEWDKSPCELASQSVDIAIKNVIVASSDAIALPQFFGNFDRTTLPEMRLKKSYRDSVASTLGRRVRCTSFGVGPMSFRKERRRWRPPHVSMLNACSVEMLFIRIDRA